jgi:hypothetical protein
MKKKICCLTEIGWELLLTFFLMFPVALYSQSLTQTVKGTVIDKDSKIPLPGAMVMIIETNPVIGSVSDLQGNFKLAGIPVGRYNLQITYIGYDPLILSEVLVATGKETVVSAELKESATTLGQVEVKAFARKDQAVNSMAMISARQLTMEEASRYAGGIDDPARLASSFAGVAGSLSSNAIVIRGNAPKGLLWRMEGVEIPNPSHFANVTTFGGGGLTALSSQMLANSDFYTGAFPAEFGNALSGVFDMRMRNGNNERREHTFKAGLTGLDFSSEGPFKNGKRSSYLFNYRYSTLALISPLLPENAQGIRYQDLSFKINLPAGKWGNLDLWGLLSTDVSGSQVKSDSSSWEYYQDFEKDQNRNRMGVMGMNHQIILNDNTYLHTSLAGTGNYIYWNRQRLNQQMDFYPKDEIAQNNRKYSLEVFINHKFGPRHTNRSGFTLNRLTYNVDLKSSPDGGSLQAYAEEKGGSGLLQVYTQSRVEIVPGIILNAGVHSQWFTLNNSLTLEPRAGIKWRISEKQSVNMAYGLHSRLEPIGFYLAQQNLSGGTIWPNKDLGLTKARHFVLGYELTTGVFSRLRLEPYYQRLFDVPVIPRSSFSMANLEMDWFFNDSLVNQGTGTNVGIDITLERFLRNGYYYLCTASLFDSKYTGGDGIERNARFDKNYVVNLLFGKEWKAGNSRNNIIGLNWRFSLIGGDRISPVNYAASEAIHDVVYDEVHAFANRKPETYYLDFTATWQRNKPRFSSTWSLQFVNLLFQKEFYGYRYNLRTHGVDPQKEAVVIPNISYKINF